MPSEPLEGEPPTRNVTMAQRICLIRENLLINNGVFLLTPVNKLKQIRQDPFFLFFTFIKYRP